MCTVRYLETLDLPIDQPEDHPDNPRVHDDDWLDDTVSPGQHRSIAARRLPDGRIQILGGHGTRRALKRRGDDTVRAELFDADDAEARWVVLSDNPRPGIGGFDHPKLLALLDAGPLEGTGWDEAAREDLEKLLEAPDLDDLAGEIGEPTDEDGLVVIKFKVDPDAKERMERLMKLTDEREESDAFSGVLAWASVGARADGLDVEP